MLSHLPVHHEVPEYYLYQTEVLCIPAHTDHRMQDERLRFQMIAEFLLLVQSHSILARLVVRLHGILIMSLLVFSVFF